MLGAATSSAHPFFKNGQSPDKKDSPSLGLFRVKVYNEHGMAQRNGMGLFPREVMRRFPLLPLEEGRLNDMPLRENSIERVLPVERARPGPLSLD
jgi:hypothetical protein